MDKIRIFDIADKNEALKILAKRNDDDLSAIDATVKDILANIKQNGDKALFMYSRMFDSYAVNENNIEVTKEEIKQAYAMVDEKMVAILKRVAQNIKAFHLKQVRKTWQQTVDGKTLGQLFNPISRCGVYVPGGKAAYPSSVLMNIVPAKVAGVGEVIMATPPSKEGSVNPLILVAADIAGADRVFKMGGAQAIGALAYGTKRVPAVYKITGPGNAYVASAKKQVFGKVGIDMIAGPSEILVIDDGSVDKRYIAADLLSQAEHDELSSCIAVVSDRTRAEELAAEILRQVKLLSKKDIAQKSITNYGMIIVAKSLEDKINFSNRIAPEHLELCIKDPEAVLKKIKNAGAVFMGAYSPEPLGDYFAGPNHIIPTNGTARFSSPLNVDDFIKKSSIIGYTKDALQACYKDIDAFATKEGLTAHAKSVNIRFEEEE